MNASEKKILYYKPGTSLVRAVGQPAFVRSLANADIPNDRQIITSDVVAYDAASGCIETLICFYIPFTGA